MKSFNDKLIELGKFGTQRGVHNYVPYSKYFDYLEVGKCYYNYFIRTGRCFNCHYSQPNLPKYNCKCLLNDLFENEIIMVQILE